MRNGLALASFVVLGLASGAYADLVKVNNFTVIGAPATTVGGTSGTVAPAGASRNTVLRFVDNSFGIDLIGAGIPGATYVVEFNYNDLTNGFASGSPGGETEFDIYTGAAEQGVLVNSLSYFNETAGWAAGNATFTPGAPTALAVGRNRFNPNAFVTTGGFNIATYDSVRVTFSFPNGDATNHLQIDMIANPEPATIALFAFGALGLGGFAWRRRNAKKPPVAQA